MSGQLLGSHSVESHALAVKGNWVFVRWAESSIFLLPAGSLLQTRDERIEVGSLSLHRRLGADEFEEPIRLRCERNRSE
jgi:hypothetical protein